MDDRKQQDSARRDDDAPEPERMITPAEEAEMDLARLEDPPQAEGPRDESMEETTWRDRRRNQGAD